MEVRPTLKSVRTANTALLLVTIVAGSVSIVPIAPLLFLATGAWCAMLVVLGRARLRPLGPSKWYLLYVTVCVVYAGVIGVDLLDWHLYRRELKFIIPFLTYVFFSLLTYRPDTPATILKTFLYVGALHAALFVVSPFVTYIDLSWIYVDSGNIWDRYGQEGYIYLGWFISHSAAGGWLAAASLLGYGLLESPDLPWRTRKRLRLLVGFLLVLLVLVRSRAFILGTAVVLAHATVRKRLTRRAYAALVGVGLLVAAGLAVPYVRGQVIATSLATLSEDEYQVSVGDYNILERYVLWGQAVDDFIKSPLVGVGATRFDDDATVISTIPKTLRPLEDVDVNPVYLEGPLLRVNVGKAQAHTDQSAHNMYLNALAEGGIALFLLLGTVIVSTLRRLLYLARLRAGLPSHLAQGVAYALYAILVAAGFGNSYLTIVPMFLLLALAGYLNSVTNGVTVLTASPPAGGSAPPPREG